MIAETRLYLISKIAEVDSYLIMLDDPIGDDDLSRIDIDCKYKIFFGSNQGEYTGNSYVEQIPVSIEVYLAFGESRVEAFDILYKKAIDIKNCIISPMSVKTNDDFNDIIFNSMSVEPLQTNDKTFKATINLTIRIDFNFN